MYNNTVIGKGLDERKRYLEKHQSEVNEIMDKLNFVMDFYFDVQCIYKKESAVGSVGMEKEV